jgi:hypothetical protein
MSTYQAKDNIVLGQQLSVQRLVLHFTITGGSGTPSAVSIVNPQPYLVGFKTAGVNQTTAMLNPGETAPTWTTVDASGEFGALVVINENLVEVYDAQLIDRLSNSVCYANVTATPVGGITTSTATPSTGGQKIALQLKSPLDLTSSATGDYALIVEYSVQE